MLDALPLPVDAIAPLRELKEIGDVFFGIVVASLAAFGGVWLFRWGADWSRKRTIEDFDRGIEIGARIGKRMRRGRVEPDD